jgi:lysophospholipase L1-like esterase
MESDYMLMRLSWVLSLVISVASTGVAFADQPVDLKVTDDWEVTASLPQTGKPALTAVVKVAPLPVEKVENEVYGSLPVFDPKKAVYARGVHLKAVKAQEVTTPFLLLPETLVVRGTGADANTVYVKGQDYDGELNWGNIGRLENGRIKDKQAVQVSYQHTMLRMDSIVLTKAGKIEYREGKAVASSAMAPELKAGEKLLANIWLPGLTPKLTANNLFPVLEAIYPEPPQPHPSIAEQRIPNTMEKLRSGKKVKILAWGDSVTDGRYVPDWKVDRWQNQFVPRLRERFPQATITLSTEAWGGRNTSSYLAVKPGEEHNYQETVLGAKPDLIISEFVNDAGMSPEAVEKRYSQFAADFKAIDAEWIILTPHYIRPDWMKLDRERDIDQDPRPYVQGLRLFADKHNIALADASLRYGHLWREGIPYSSLMSNSINHPDPRGMKIFADALMEIFPEK